MSRSSGGMSRTSESMQWSGGGTRPLAKSAGGKTKPTEEQIEALKSRFSRLDKNGDGTLDFLEMSLMLRSGKPDMTDRELNVLYRGIDKNGDGKVGFKEFVNFIFDVQRKSPDSTNERTQRDNRPYHDPDAEYSKGERVTARRSDSRCCDQCGKHFQHDHQMTGVIQTNTIELELPGRSGTVTLHSDGSCFDRYVNANALRCDMCQGPIVEHLTTVQMPGSHEKATLHRQCVDAYQYEIGDRSGGHMFDTHSHRRGVARTTPDVDQAADNRPGRRGASHAQDERNAARVSDASYCYQCGQAFRHYSPTGGVIQEGTTELGLPGLSGTVTLHSEGSCYDRFVEENALRCDQCGGPIVEYLTRVQLPFSKVQATLHRNCEHTYAECNAIRCVHCNRSIVESGVSASDGRHEYFLHKKCVHKFRR